jgi:2-polyprenyl-6-hydroxyphenyl methylase/3-demethylubiquinone-9 3-methyltransferase
MAIGPIIRKLFGPFEQEVSNLYRRIFINLDDLSSKIRRKVSCPNEILEIGCGEGAMTERLAKAYPTSNITAIDISANLGRLLSGGRQNIEFIQTDVENLLRSFPGRKYDLVVMVDVLHHISSDREKTLRNIKNTLNHQGVFVLKEMNKSRHPVYFLGYFSDYYITGDKCVSYYSVAELRQLIYDIFGPDSIKGTDFIRPWKTNMVFFVG